MKKIALLLVLLMVSSLALVGCGEKAPEQTEQNQTGQADVDFSKLVQVKGSDTMVNLGQRWAEEFMDKYPEAQIAVTGGGSGTGIAAIINGTADIAQSSRKMKEAELEQAKANGFELKEFVPGKDGIAIAVHKDNPIETLTMDDLKAIFTGEKTNWKDFGGNDAPITLYSRESNSGTYAFFKEFVLKDEEYAQSSNLMPSTQAIVEALKQDVNGIGYIGLGYLSNEVKAVKISKDANSEAIAPSLETVKSGAYPVARGLYIYTAGEPQGVIKLYVDFMMGPEGQKVVEEVGFIPVK
ncbi:phosphate ABC transporter substrate-binding protein, PhoT family [Alkalithermobacter thermoalcaliphilus JW-YL-7 = DSM 7308]|uniref:Phosphate-binding protein n=1 Tax=Alkalithermobacter thermoalcaliphilus JW-YL-7 = DSM 7308 TaxID=1121328 RepID=A0A150FSX9_CLOPD|nr:phosphate binding protein [[Clostridium] paradoxum JW-YL-7 = DSM 7308]SHL34210.1 phosphate ABC transporter substrate-binding protein, PhoT family [[Clostridium] paradoxum JW-YL-7 = DSM 7308]